MFNHHQMSLEELKALSDSALIDLFETFVACNHYDPYCRFHANKYEFDQDGIREELLKRLGNK
jgi:hypothetical protein